MAINKYDYEPEVWEDDNYSQEDVYADAYEDYNPPKAKPKKNREHDKGATRNWENMPEFMKHSPSKEAAAKKSATPKSKAQKAKDWQDDFLEYNYENFPDEPEEAYDEREDVGLRNLKQSLEDSTRAEIERGNREAIAANPTSRYTRPANIPHSYLTLNNKPGKITGINILSNGPGAGFVTMSQDFDDGTKGFNLVPNKGHGWSK